MGRLSRQREAKEARTKFGGAEPLKKFFDSHGDFVLVPEASSAMEFNHLKNEKGWKRGDVAGEVAWQEYRTALVMEFNSRFGTQANDLLAWQTLCRVVGIKEAEKVNTCEECELLLKSRHFNLVDVLDAYRLRKDETVRTFASAEALEEYTRATASYFPVYHVAAGGFLKRVLRKEPGVRKS